MGLGVQCCPGGRHVPPEFSCVTRGNTFASDALHPYPVKCRPRLPPPGLVERDARMPSKAPPGPGSRVRSPAPLELLPAAGPARTKTAGVGWGGGSSCQGGGGGEARARDPDDWTLRGVKDDTGGLQVGRSALGPGGLPGGEVPGAGSRPSGPFKSRGPGEREGRGRRATARSPAPAPHGRRL